ncbi:Ca2+-transporting ATPase [Cnuella takakiae]|uniref:Ca2+-transporting ATPase n=1 Tax=Cnuella takakiae TaxID=1302690 RepID=A0A1M4UUP6_9BACT|nr:cation-translocating P-type ATPase [Cnuella takakiae]OLY92775.1 haloacid dehalogenase [Cnuella takakiae]SHE60343.1 Ca2+-transporting ATPase [Cnuella takakiae]
MNQVLNTEFSGLSSEAVLLSRKEHGNNILVSEKSNPILEGIKDVLSEPMVILLLVAAAIYFISGSTGDAIFLLSAVLLVAAISLFQENRSRMALEQLKDFTQPLSKVIRNGSYVAVKSEELVVGDYLVVEEGAQIPADATIIQSNDFSVNESLLTGESLTVAKDRSSDPLIYAGTLVSGGRAIAIVQAIGMETKLGKIGKSLEQLEAEPTALEKQIAAFVHKMVLVGALVFLIVWGINFFQTYQLLDSLLKALTLAMSILPEEIPVAFTTFMALGAWRLMKKGVVVKQMKTVETLGSATIICTDKTGTITENSMQVAKLFTLLEQRITPGETIHTEAEKCLIQTAMLASEPIPFDPMELAILDAYTSVFENGKRPTFKMVHEYPLEGRPPMMTHVMADQQDRQIVAAKGAPEALMPLCALTPLEVEQLSKAIDIFTADGLRVLAVASTHFDGKAYPEKQQDFSFRLLGILAFADPPKENIPLVLQQFYDAGIDVKMITGDNPATARSIAKAVQLKGYEQGITGDALMQLDDAALQQVVMHTHVFSRMFPEAKLRIINALKASNQVVAMTGDGVNDGPALKAAHIGIAMGKRGSEIAKDAASLILLTDDFSKMVAAVAMGRRIYTNLKKAIQYIISIHIPIVLTVFLPLALGWVYPNIFSPVHIIFLELVMGPTCSIVYENEPLEPNLMQQPPRPYTTNFFNIRELSTSILQGLVITAGCLLGYQIMVQQGASEALTRTLTFSVLVIANIFLTLVNRSFYYSVFTTLRYPNKLITFVILITVLILVLLVFVPPLTAFFGFAQMDGQQWGLALLIGFCSVIWYEGVKWGKRIRKAGNLNPNFMWRTNAANKADVDLS